MKHETREERLETAVHYAISDLRRLGERVTRENGFYFVNGEHQTIEEIIQYATELVAIDRGKLPAPRQWLKGGDDE